MAHPMYATWAGMMSRCHNENHPDYRYWGGRGVKVCDEWHDFKAFILDMGIKASPELEIDRIDNNKGYSKDNCRYVTRTENMRNTRRAHYLTINGEKLCLSAWAERIGIKPETFRNRCVTARWDIDKISQWVKTDI